MKKISLILIFSLIQQNSWGYEFIPYNFQEIEKCDNKFCLEKNKLKSYVLTQSYSSQYEYEKLFQTRKTILLKLGNILPHFNLGTGIGAINMGLGSYLEGAGTLVSSFLGFLFPSRWYKWKESKMFFQSQRYSYMTLLANQVNNAENIFYNVQREFTTLKILKHYILEVEKIIQIVNERDDNGEVPYEEIIKLDVLRSELITTKILIENVMKELIPELVHLLGMDPFSSWKKFRLKLEIPPDLKEVEYLDAMTYFEESLEKSTELKSLKYLAYGAKYSRRYRYFSFLDPSSEGENSFGFGYFANIRIAQSESRKIEIRKDEMYSKIKKLLFHIENSHNTALDLFKEAIHGRLKSFELIQISMNDFWNTGNLETQDIIDSLQSMMKFDLYQNLSVNMYFNSISQFNRILWKDISKEYIVNLIPKRSIRLHRFRDRSLRIENRRIDNAIRRNEIAL